MAIHEQTPEQTTPTRPTPEQATEAQAYFARPEILDIAKSAIRHELGEKGVRHFETILAVAKAPTDEDIDARFVAFCKERGLRATHSDLFVFDNGVRAFLGLVKP